MSEDFYGYTNIETRVVFLEFFDGATIGDFLEDEERENLPKMREWDCFDIPSIAGILKEHVESYLEETCQGFGFRVALDYVSRVDFEDIAESLIVLHLNCLPVNIATYRRKKRS